MQKNTFKTPNIEKRSIDPLSQLLLQQNNKLKKENHRLKKDSSTDNPITLELGDLVFDLAAHKVFFNKEDLLLANREYDLLLYLANHVNSEVTYQELSESLFGSYLENDKRSIMVIISRLRKKMTIDIKLENMLESIRGVGYKLVYNSK